jgi:WD40 repeat protein
VNIVVNNEEGIIFSLSDGSNHSFHFRYLNIMLIFLDKMIKLWNARNLMCVQTMVDKTAHRPENTISSIYYDSINRKIVTGSGKIELWPLFSNSRHLTQKSHESPIISALFNSNFNQVVSGCQTGTITLWDPIYGDKIFEFHRPHGVLQYLITFSH